jgi:hypothetical protein
MNPKMGLLFLILTFIISPAAHSAAAPEGLASSPRAVSALATTTLPLLPVAHPNSSPLAPIFWSVMDEGDVGETANFLHNKAVKSGIPTQQEAARATEILFAAHRRGAIVGRVAGVIVAFASWWKMDDAAFETMRDGGEPPDPIKSSSGPHLHIEHAVLRDGYRESHYAREMYRELLFQNPQARTFSGFRLRGGQKEHRFRDIGAPGPAAARAGVARYYHRRYQEAVISASRYGDALDIAEEFGSRDPTGAAQLLASLFPLKKIGMTARYSLLQTLCWQGHADLVRRFVTLYRNFDPAGLKKILSADPTGDSAPLIGAADRGDVATLDFIIEAYASADPADLSSFLEARSGRQQGTAVNHARSVEMFQHLVAAYKMSGGSHLAKFIAGDWPEWGPSTTLIAAASNQNADLASEIISEYRRADPNGFPAFLRRTDRAGNDYLTYAALNNNHAFLDKVSEREPAALSEVSVNAVRRAFIGKRFDFMFRLLISGLPLPVEKRWLAAGVLAGPELSPNEFQVDSLYSQIVTALVERYIDRFPPRERRNAARIDALRAAYQARFAIADHVGEPEHYRRPLFLHWYMAVSHRLVQALGLPPIQFQGRQLNVSELFLSLYDALPQNPDWGRMQGILQGMTFSEIDGVKDMFRALTRDLILGPLLRDAQSLGEPAYEAVEAALTANSVQRILDELVVPLANAVIAENGLGGKDLTTVLDFSRDWHKQLHGPLRVIRTIPLEGSWRSMFRGPDGRPVVELDFSVFSDEPSFPEELHGWSAAVLVDPAALSLEGKEMDHCVGSHAPECLAGRAQVVSLRDGIGKPQATLGFRIGAAHDSNFRSIKIPNADSYLQVFQNQGYRNSTPPVQSGLFLDFLERGLENGTFVLNHDWGPSPTDAATARRPLLQTVGFEPSEMVALKSLTSEAADEPKYPRDEAVFRLYEWLLFAKSRGGGVSGRSLLRGYTREGLYRGAGLAIRARYLLAREISETQPELAERLRNLRGSFP